MNPCAYSEICRMNKEDLDYAISLIIKCRDRLDNNDLSDELWIEVNKFIASGYRPDEKDNK